LNDKIIIFFITCDFKTLQLGVNFNHFILKTHEKRARNKFALLKIILKAKLLKVLKRKNKNLPISYPSI